MLFQRIVLILRPILVVQIVKNILKTIVIVGSKVLKDYWIFNVFVQVKIQRRPKSVNFLTRYYYNEIDQPINRYDPISRRWWHRSHTIKVWRFVPRTKYGQGNWGAVMEKIYWNFPKIFSRGRFVVFLYVHMYIHLYHVHMYVYK